MSAAVHDDGAGVALGRKGAGLVVEGQDGPLLGNLGFVAAKVVPSVGADVVGAADVQAGGPAVLEDYDAGFAL